MITKPELQELLQTTETYRMEHTTSTNGTQDGTQDGTQKQLEEKIISLIKANPKISRKDIATATQTSPRTIARRIKEMNDKIRFVGSGYSGHWEVIGSKH